MVEDTSKKAYSFILSFYHENIDEPHLRILYCVFFNIEIVNNCNL
jgi:hypothetical protein